MTRPLPVDRSQRRFPIEELVGQIADLLKTEPRTAYDLARLTHYSVATCRLRVAELERVGRAHRERVNTPTGCQYVWHYGPSPSRGEALGIFGIPQQSAYRVYPAINRRDPLVAALFGEAGVRP
ncbi:hypothetical protein IP92_05772 [Pseudoduganella flava]|uniref:Uncharacterized protein n=1 Tax=Pseudoduganella flava TaxID=871742 RepID=A0A562P9H2_9BURK|nr:hypothetical protein [Pseudoduganella flava]QGZ42697.1 hypothetical protein GO485_29130 [Pseudoduganella flava]TWI41051.1 hypothetical protein IP92_05772 [Pseudoduganella flava]